MKKLNSKGFTLIELLAVIVVLAIVMVIAVTSVLNSTSNAAVNSFNSSALTVADFAKQQESLAVMGTGNAETCYENWRKTANLSSGDPVSIGNNYATCFGINETDYDAANSSIKVVKNNTTGVNEVTVTLCAGTDGKFNGISTNGSVTVVTSEIDPDNADLKCVTVTK